MIAWEVTHGSQDPSPLRGRADHPIEQGVHLSKDSSRNVSVAAEVGRACGRLACRRNTRLDRKSSPRARRTQPRRVHVMTPRSSIAVSGREQVLRFRLACRGSTLSRLPEASLSVPFGTEESQLSKSTSRALALSKLPQSTPEVQSWEGNAELGVTALLTRRSLVLGDGLAAGQGSIGLNSESR